MGIKLNHQPTTYLHPVFFYGANYTLSPSHSISLNGQYTHTLFDPSNKNAMTIPISALEVKVGNPYLRPIKVVSNTAAYNGTIGSLGMELPIAARSISTTNSDITIPTRGGSTVPEPTTGDSTAICSLYRGHTRY